MSALIDYYRAQLGRIDARRTTLKGELKLSEDSIKTLTEDNERRREAIKFLDANEALYKAEVARLESEEAARVAGGA